MVALFFFLPFWLPLDACSSFSISLLDFINECSSQGLLLVCTSPLCNKLDMRVPCTQVVKIHFSL